jgi:Cu/Ag efflux protein CusF
MTTLIELNLTAKHHLKETTTTRAVQTTGKSTIELSKSDAQRTKTTHTIGSTPMTTTVMGAM